jgi:hypothetical protein
MEEYKVDKLDISWIDEFMKYEEFYKEKVDNFNLYCIYIDKANNIIDIKQDKILIDNPILTNKEIIYMINKHNNETNNKYKLLKMFNYNFDISEENIIKFLKEENNYYFINTYNFTNDINWKDTIQIFQNLNSLYFIYQEKNKLSFNKTLKKKSILKTNKKNKQIHTKKIRFNI